MAGPMRTLTGGQAVVEALAAAGVDVVFGIVGVHNMHIYDALYHEPRMRAITPRHEQGAAFMADGYARASGRVGVVLLISGPGGTNAATGVAQAYADSSPLLVIQSDVASSLLGREVGTLHEMQDQRAFFRSITQQSQRIERSEAIPEAIGTAMAQLQVGRPRPIHIDIPADVLAARASFPAELRAPPEPAREKADSRQVSEAADLLRAVQRPVIYAGGGTIVAGATGELVALAELLQAPVVTTTHARGAIPDDHPLGLGNAWGRSHTFVDLAQQADVVLAVGTRLSELGTGGWSLPMPKHVIQVDINADTFGQRYPVRTPLHGDAKAVLAQLLQAMEGYTPPSRDAFLRLVGEWRDQQAHLIERAAPVAGQFLTALRGALERDAIVVNDMTMPSYWAQRFFPVFEPRTFLFPFYFGTLGFSLPAAIGAKLAQPDRQVVAICGDGGFLFTVQELATAVQLGLNLAVVVFNDNCFSGVKAAQDRELGGRHIGVELRNPDFVALGKAFGARSRRVRDVAQLAAALETAFAAEGPSLIEVPVGLPSPRSVSAID
jgi:thiamine pyrophosphate-dependent acetolactate synthase large subunit-like protein